MPAEFALLASDKLGNYPLAAKYLLAIIIVYSFSLFFGLKSVAQPSRLQINTITLLNKNTASEQSYIDSLRDFKSDLYSDIKPLIEKSGRYLEQFSICIKTGKDGDVDSILVSDNMDPALKTHFWQTQNKSVYNGLIRYSKLNGWKNTYLIMPVLILYEDIKSPTLADLLEHRNSLQNIFSFNSRDFLQRVQPIRLLDPLILIFGTRMR